MGFFSVDCEKAVAAINLAPGADLNEAIRKLDLVCSEKSARISNTEEKELIDQFVKELNTLQSEPNRDKKLNLIHDLTLKFLIAYDGMHKENNPFKKSISLYLQKMYEHPENLTLLIHANKQLVKEAMIRKGKEQFKQALKSNEVKQKKENITFSQLTQTYKAIRSETYLTNLAIMGQTGLLLQPLVEYMSPPSDDPLIMQHKTAGEKMTGAMIDKGVDLAKDKAKEFLKKRLGTDYEDTSSTYSSEEGKQVIKEELKRFFNVIKERLMCATNITGRNYIPKETEKTDFLIDFDFNKTFNLMYDKLTTLNLSDPESMLDSINLINEFMSDISIIMLIYRPDEDKGDTRNLMGLALEGNENLFAMFKTLTGILSQLNIPDEPTPTANNEILNKYNEAIGKLKEAATVFDKLLDDAAEYIQNKSQQTPPESSWLEGVSSFFSGAFNMMSGIATLGYRGVMGNNTKKLLSLYTNHFSKVLAYEDRLTRDVDTLTQCMTKLANEGKNLTSLIDPVLKNVDINALQRSLSLFKSFFEPFAKNPKSFLQLSPEDREHFVLNMVSMIHSLADATQGLPELIKALGEHVGVIEMSPELTICLNNLIVTLGHIQTAISPYEGFIAEAGEVLSKALPELVPGIDKTIARAGAQTPGDRIPHYLQGKNPMTVLRNDIQRIDNNLGQLPRVEVNASTTSRARNQ